MVGAPEQSFHDAELIAMNGLAIDYFTGTVGSELMFTHEKVVVFDFSNGLLLFLPFLILLFLFVGEQHFLVGFLVDKPDVFLVYPQQFIAPPSVILRGRCHLFVVRTAEIQVFEGKLLQLLGVKL